MNHAALVCSLATALLAFPMVASAQTAATPAPVPPKADASAPRSVAPTPCEKAQQLVSDQKRSMAIRAERTAGDKRERESCKTPPDCKKLDRVVAAAEEGRKKDEARLARYEAEAARACKGG